MRNTVSEARHARHPPQRAPWRAWSLAAVLAVIALLTAGWPLASLAFSDSQPLAAGQTLVIGPDPAHDARFTVGPGWILVKSESNPKQGYSLRLGAVDLTVSYVTLSGRGQAGHLWAGLRQITLAGHTGSRLGRERQVRISPAETEDTGPLAEGSEGGLAAILPDPPADFAIEITILGPSQTDASGQRAAARVVRSFALSAARR